MSLWKLWGGGNFPASLHGRARSPGKEEENPRDEYIAKVCSAHLALAWRLVARASQRGCWEGAIHAF